MNRGRFHGHRFGHRGDGHRHGGAGVGEVVLVAVRGSAPFQQILDFLTRQGFVFQQGLGHLFQIVGLVGQNLAGLIPAGRHQPLDLGIDDAGGLFRDVLAARDRVTQEEACWMSDEAPDVMFSLPKISSSATRPPAMMAIRSTIC